MNIVFYLLLCAVRTRMEVRMVLAQTVGERRGTGTLTLS